MGNGIYGFIVDGATVPLRKTGNIRYVTPARGVRMMNLAARLARSSRLALDSGYPADALVVWGDRSKLDEIRTYRDVRNTRSAFQDLEGNLLILTNEVLVCFASKVTDAEKTHLLKGFKGRIVERRADVWKFYVDEPDDDAPLLVSNELSRSSVVAYAEPNALQHIHLQMPGRNEPRFPDQWHLRNTGQNGGTAGADVDALGAWAITAGSPNVQVVVHDSGVDINHPDLVANIAPGWDFDNGDNDATNDAGPHGTACAGIIAAAINGAGVSGIAPRCQIVPLRAAAAHTWDEWAGTFDWAAQRGRIISCSWTITPNNTLSAAIRRAVNNGVAVFCAAGNNGTGTISYPASLAETIAVGASTNRDVRAGYSQFGVGLDVVAPSSGGTLRIETTDVRGANGYNAGASPGGDYCNANDASGFGGTSAATPLTAGVAALMLSVNPALTPAEIRQILQSTADKIDPINAAYDATGWSNQYGFGRVNAARAVQGARPPYAPVYAQGDPGNGIGGYDLKSPADRAFAFDYDHSGKLDHIVLYRPATGTMWILKNNGGAFSPVYAQGDPGNGIGGYDLKSPADRAFAFDYDHSGKLDHIVLYRPATGTMWILKNNGGAFSPVYAQGDPGNGIGGYDLRSPADRAFAFDYDHSGKLDHIVLYRPATGTMWILKNNGGAFSPVYAQGDPGNGIGGYDLRSPADLAFAFDYDHSGKLDHIALYRPGTGTMWILRNSGGAFSPVYAQGDPGNGIGGYDLKSSRDRALAFDYDHSGKLDHIALYRPGTGTMWILRNNGGAFSPVYAQGDPGNGIGGYDLKSAADLAFALDYDHSGKLDHMGLYRPGTGTMWLLRRQ
ncbi:MAG: S8 family serine peptidase [Polyangiaceae bacterium]|nr:S8 family serine peptidase [Polyangiaceae bacterium]